MTPDMKALLQQGGMRAAGGAAAGGALGAYVDGTPEGAAWGALGGGLGGLGSMAFRTPAAVPPAASRYMHAVPPAGAGGAAEVGAEALRASAGLTPKPAANDAMRAAMGLGPKTAAYHDGYSDALALYGLEKEAWAPLIAAGARMAPTLLRAGRSLMGGNIGGAAKGVQAAARGGWRTFAKQAPRTAGTLQTAGNIAKNPLVQTGAIMAAT